MEDWRTPESAYNVFAPDHWQASGRDDYRDAARQRRWLAAGKTGWWWQASPEEQREVFGT